MHTIDRIAGAALSLFALGVIWESRKLPLGTFHVPGPAFAAVLLASLLLIFGVLIAATGGRAERFRSLRWEKWPHADAMFQKFWDKDAKMLADAVKRIGRVEEKEQK